MKFTLSWLKQHLKTDADIDQIAAAMTMAGLEVEEIENPAEKLSAFSIAKVLTAEKHPDADKLKVCTVETRDGVKTIVCGAPNARADMTVAYAPMGAYIPGSDFSLDKKPRKIRGVESSGMMCSGAELGLDNDHDGILDLDASFEMGAPIADALGLNDPVIDFEVTPNRPDWLGVDNIARDLAATGLGQWITPQIKPVIGKGACDVTIKIAAPAACPQFAGRVIRGVKNGPSPKWLQDKLTAIGLKPISALVDLTNYISYDRARPLHVYDMAKLSGPIRARMGAGETFTALDDKEYKCDETMCVIADDERVLGFGGMMGGTYSGCSDETTDVFIECAYFDPLTIRRSAQKTGIQSDAKYRFERGVDTHGLIDGLEMCSALILEICGGEASEISIIGDAPTPPADIQFDPALNKRLSGFDLSDQTMIDILQTLGFGVQAKSSPWTVSVPTRRRDCTSGADLVEEIVRIYGLDKMQAVSLPPLEGRHEAPATPLQNKIRFGRRALAARGLSEAVTWSFCSRPHAKAFDGGDASLVLTNPISSDLDCMRPSALIHLLLASQRSADRGMAGAALFEAGPTYQNNSETGQAPSLAGIRRLESARHWQGNITPDAFSAKADAIAALAAMGAKTDNLQMGKPSGSYWHPGRSGRLQMGPKNILADFGELHPTVLKQLGIEGRVCAFEVWPNAVPSGRKKASKSKGALKISDLMPVHRDFAFIVADDIGADKIIRAVKGADKALITDVNLFDVYTGKGVDDGFKSLALDVTLSPTKETLTDKDIEQVSQKIIAQAAKAGGVLRG